MKINMAWCIMRHDALCFLVCTVVFTIRGAGCKRHDSNSIYAMKDIFFPLNARGFRIFMVYCI